ncbi:MAG: hypothetical protein PF551_04560 [Candidatus Marinimicrobia bacterium]|nr:hypothetical protein [Candidatus Neomarinimicrobiota bacterium]
MKIRQMSDEIISRFFTVREQLFDLFENGISMMQLDSLSKKYNLKVSTIKNEFLIINNKRREDEVF